MRIESTLPYLHSMAERFGYRVARIGNHEAPDGMSEYWIDLEAVDGNGSLTLGASDGKWSLVNFGDRSGQWLADQRFVNADKRPLAPSASLADLMQNGLQSWEGAYSPALRAFKEVNKWQST